MPAEAPFDQDVIIVGAGAAGIGLGCVFRSLGLERLLLLERHEIGASFRRWPKEMRFISPSFPSNAFGLLDLNSVALGTSPAYQLDREHPSGRQYAAYLRRVAEEAGLAIQSGVEVLRIAAEPDGGFEVVTRSGSLRSRFVIWAAGEFQYPNAEPFPGAGHCLHSSLVRSWKDLSGDEFLVIGGYESGIDAAVALCRAGKHVRVLERGEPWTSGSRDPSIALSPYTQERMERALATGRLELVSEVSVTGVERTETGFRAVSSEGRQWDTPVPPILATGFTGSLGLVGEHFDWHAEGYALLTHQDESTRVPGLFLAGPRVRHGTAILCFIYKFRQRFAVVADAIAQRLGLDRGPIAEYRSRGMFLEDPECCADECVC